jgi:hypothetical protein
MNGTSGAGQVIASASEQVMQDHFTSIAHEWYTEYRPVWATAACMHEQLAVLCCCLPTAVPVQDQQRQNTTWFTHDFGSHTS